MPATDWGWQISPEELESWILHEDANLLVVNKPPFVVCHPSKHGPWSSLIGACRERLGTDRLHIAGRLDRETSGVVVLAKNQLTASLLQSAAQKRQVMKIYRAIVCGHLAEPVMVDQPIGKDPNSVVYVRRWVNPSTGKAAQTLFEPLAHGTGYTYVSVRPITGRMHQIRVHASWLGHALVGDKLYGPDPLLLVEFREHGFAGRLPWMLPLHRHALHASQITYRTYQGEFHFEAPLSHDMATFLHSRSICADC